MIFRQTFLILLVVVSLRTQEIVVDIEGPEPPVAALNVNVTYTCRAIGSVVWSINGRLVLEQNFVDLLAQSGIFVPLQQDKLSIARINAQRINNTQLQCVWIGSILDGVLGRSPVINFTTYGLLSLVGNEAFYMVGTQINVDCINNNEVQEYMGPGLWMNSNGMIVSDWNTLNLTATRDLAGNYTCIVPSAPFLPAVIFQVVVYYVSNVNITYPSERIVDVMTNISLDCSTFGVPTPNVTWTINDAEVDINNPNINITNIISGFKMTSTLTWTNVPTGASGRYCCIFTNDAGSDNATYHLQITSSSNAALSIGVTSAIIVIVVLCTIAVLLTVLCGYRYFSKHRSNISQQHDLEQINTETCVAYGVTSEVRTTASGEYEDVQEYYT